MSGQIIMISLEDLVPANHVYRKFLGIWDFSGIKKLLKDIEKDNNYKDFEKLHRAYEHFRSQHKSTLPKFNSLLKNDASKSGDGLS